ncbi:MAG: hypothetical protein OHK0053_03260 [Microscillaceae bacterium]
MIPNFWVHKPNDTLGGPRPGFDKINLQTNKGLVNFTHQINLLDIQATYKQTGQG